jgi:hypothetical protein
MKSLRIGAIARRGAVLFAVCLAVAASVAARPAAPGITFRMRMATTPPEIPGMPPMAPTIVVGRGTAIGTLSRFDFDSVSGEFPVAVGDYMLALDSGRVILVSPSSKSFSEGMPAAMGLSPDLLAQATVSGANVTTEKLGPGETMHGYKTEKVRMTITYTLGLMGQALNTMTVMEMSLAQLPASVSTPFDGNLPKEMRTGSFKELADKVDAARKSLGSGTPIKTVTTASLSGPMSITLVTTVDMMDIKAGDIDPALLKVPEGFAKRP